MVKAHAVRSEDDGRAVERGDNPLPARRSSTNVLALRQ
jgi:hypothetical protein